MGAALVLTGWPWRSCKKMLRSAKGDLPVYLYFEREKKMILLDENHRAPEEPAFLEQLEQLLGSGSVRLEELKPGLWNTLSKR
jgi:hypothetical protein